MGTNLVRLSQIDDVDKEVYSSILLPSLMQEVVDCHDTLAQAYMMEVVMEGLPQ